MIVHALLTLGSLGVASVLTLGVTTHVGPDLSARSMTGYVEELSAAQRGETVEVDRIGAQLEHEWRRLAALLADAVEGAADDLADAADGLLRD